MKYGLVDRCPVPAKLVPVVNELKRRSGATLNSCYRGDDARGLLNANGKSSQKQLWDGWVARRPGFNPANPPGRSTHELRNDGVAYPGPAGMRLLYWQVGQDWSNAPGVVAAAAALGYTATVTYPNNPREGHHINLRKAPVKPFLKLKRGSKGPRVALLTKRLKRLKLLKGSRWNYDQPVVQAIKAFQRAHHQKADGVYGVQTHRQMVYEIRKLNKKK